VQSTEVIKQLQETLLTAVLMHKPLPGSDQPLNFPDFSFIERQPVIYVVNENLAGPISIEGLPKPLHILSRDDLQQEARKHGDLTYFYFHPLAKENSAVRLTLEAKLIPQNPEHYALGLGGIQVTFHEVDGRWEALGDDQSSFAT
jgi:hypothetical protein